MDDNNYDMSWRMNKIEENVGDLLRHKIECILMHERHEEHGRRHDDTSRQLTESNLMLAKSVTDMNITLSRFAEILDVENGSPDIKLIRNTRNFGLTGWKIFLTIGAAAAVIAGIIAAYKAVTGL